MATAGPRYPGTVATEVGPSGDNDWLTPGNVSADDGSEAQITAATYDAADHSYRLKATNFGFDVDIPASATIDGITVEIEQRRFAGAAEDQEVRLYNSEAALTGDDKQTATAWPATATIATYGSASDMWTSGLTADDIRSANFGVAHIVLATAANTDIGVDFIRVTVDYTALMETDVQLTGGGVLTAAGSGTHNNASQLVGGGILALATAAQKAIGVPLAGGGVLTAVTFKTSDRAIGLTGSGVLNVTASAGGGAEQHDTQAQLTASGLLFAAASGEHNQSAQLTGGGILAAAVQQGGQDVGLSATMDALAVTAPVERKYAYPADGVTVPCVVIGYPEIELDIAYGNTKRETVYPVYVLVGKVNELSARNTLDEYISSVPPALQGTLGGIVDYAGVKTVKVLQVTVGGIAYLAGLFSTEVMEAA